MRSKYGWKLPLLLVLILAAISGVVYLWDFVWEINSPLLASVVAGLLVVISTIFGIDRLLAYRENVKWKQAKSSVLMEINTCLNGMLTNVRGLAKIDWPALVAPSTKGLSSDEWAKQASDIITEYFEERSGPLAPEIAQAIRQRDQGSWDSFFSGILSCISELDRILATFPSITSEPELVGKMIAVRKATRLLVTVRITFFDVLGVPLEKQPMPRSGDRASASNGIHDLALKLLDELVISIVSAKKVVDKMLYKSV
jgi:hypothetical protein